MANGLDGEALLDRHFEQVYAYVAYRVAPDAEAARDITQDVFLAACRSADSLQNEAAALGWLRAIARSRVADHFRSAARRGETLAPPEALAELPAAESGAAYDEPQVRAMQVSHVMRALPDDYGDVLEEKYLEGRSVRDMAARRGQSEKAVESMLTRAREAFRETWRRMHGEDVDSGFGTEGTLP
jgi:RNA polymerase sigma-70 factor, ECF subfamily